jgi:Holliday junction resolvase
MGRRAAKVDANQAELVKIMRDMGVSVEITSAAHDGMTDLVVGFGGISVLVEVKDGSKPPSVRKLTPKQVEFHSRFMGAITVIETVDQAIQLVNTIRQVAAKVKVNWYMGAVANAGR